MVRGRSFVLLACLFRWQASLLLVASPLFLYYGAFGNKPLPLRLFFPKPGQYQMVLLGEKRYRFVLECGATGENGGVR
jgi:hypothetical protein